MSSTLLENRQGQPKFLIYLLVILLCILPSLLPWRYEPYLSFYSDMVVGMFASLLAIYLFINSDKVKHSVTAISLLLFALYLPLQSMLIQFPYVGSALYISGLFVLLALLLTAILSVPKSIFRYMTFSILWGIVILSSIQICLYLIQFAITDSVLKEQLSWLIFSGEGGQIGQRNNLSHIIMWGLVATIILERKGKLSSVMMWLLVFCYAIAMAHAGSRSVLLYILGLSAMAGYQLFIIKEENSRLFARNVLIALTIALFAQFAVPFVLNLFMSSNISSGADRIIGDSEYLSRWLEWKKAWLAFLDAPLLGHGWGSYGFQSFWYHDQVATIGVPRADNYFSNTHNVLLQLLAEVGLLGTLLIVTPITMILLKAFFKYTSDIMTFGLLMICVISLLHSMVEFPLWSSNLLIIFFLVFFLMVRRVGSDNATGIKLIVNKSLFPRVSKIKWVQICITFTLIIMMSILLILMDHERQVRKTLALRANIVEAQKIAIGVQGRYIPFYKKYSDRLEIFRVDPNKEDVKQIHRSDVLLVNNMKVFPYYTYIASHIIYLQKMGKQDEVRLWLDKLILYYPRILPGLIQLTQDYPEDFEYLQSDILEKCHKVVASQIYGLDPQSCSIKVL